MERNAPISTMLRVRPIDRKCGDVASVVAVINPDGDLGSPVDNTEPAAVGMLPVGVDFGEECLESGVVFVLLMQGVLLTSQGRALLPAQLQLQVRQFSGKPNGIAKPVLAASSISTTARARRRSPQTRMC